MTSVAIIDYGRGNVRSVYNALDYAGADAVMIGSPFASCEGAPAICR